MNRYEIPAVQNRLATLSRQIEQLRRQGQGARALEVGSRVNEVKQAAGFIELARFQKEDPAEHKGHPVSFYRAAAARIIDSNEGLDIAEIDIEAACEMRRQGFSSEQIGAALDESPATVSLPEERKEGYKSSILASMAGNAVEKQQPADEEQSVEQERSRFGA